jgi:hypothetical protein
VSFRLNQLPPGIAERIVRGVLVLFFLWLVARFWHPFYGFTRFLELDTNSAAATVPELRDAPFFTYEYGYDGHYYAQLAARPLVNDPALAGSIDNVGYRARRILLSWTAWAVGLGEPVAAVRAYAWLNLVVWGVLAALLWRIFPLGDWRGTLAWAGVLFSAGVLHSVRLALTDLLALLLVAGAARVMERSRGGVAAGFLGLAGLTRETSLLGAIVLWPGASEKKGGWLRAAGWSLLAALPLALWLAYLRRTLGPTEPGMGNFMLPVTGWLWKWSEAFHRLQTETDRYLALTTLLAHLALSVQLIYLACRPQLRDTWWRLGAAYGALLLFLGVAVWAGHPGAALRVLLPMTLAFNVCAVRQRAAVGWLILGNLAVLSGVLTLWQVPRDPHEIAADWTAKSGYVVQTDARWFAVERGGNRIWAWCAQDGGLEIKAWPRRDGVADVRLRLRAFAPREIEIRCADRVVWHGQLSEQLQWIDLTGLPITGGHVTVQLHSAVAPVNESAAPNARTLGFAVYGVELH